MKKVRPLLSLIAGLFFVLVALALVLPALGVPGLPNVIGLFFNKNPATDPGSTQPTSVRLVDGKRDTFEVDADIIHQLGIARPLRVEAIARPRLLTLSGTLAFDPARLARVQSRFPGEVVELGTTRESSVDEGGRPVQEMPLAYGSVVRKGQLLAVVWSKDLGEKKSELVDALAQLSLDQETLARLEDLYRTAGGTSEAVLRQARRNVSADINAINKAERTLRIWKVPDNEIRAVEDEAKRVIARKGKRDPAREKDWARVEIHSPIDGVIVEKNVVRGNIVDTTSDLYKVADMSRLAVYLHVYEEDLRVLQRLADQRRPASVPWRLFLAADPGRTPLKNGGIDRIGLVVDPNQHTNMAFGWVDNTLRQLRVGQFVTAEVDLPAPPHTVSVPIAALDEDGASSCLFVQENPALPRYTIRNVHVTRRFHDFAWVSSRLTGEQKKAGLQEVRPGEWVVPAGSVQLKAALDGLRASGSAHR